MQALRGNRATLARMGFERFEADDQPRDDNGRWTGGGDSGSSGPDGPQGDSGVSRKGEVGAPLGLSDLPELKGFLVDIDTVQPRQGRDELLESIYDARGFHGKPELVDSATFDARFGAGEIMYRGVPKESYADDFMTGDRHYGGLGSVGSGTFTAIEGGELRGGLRGATSYADDTGVIMRMGLKDGAKVLEWDQVKELMNRDPVSHVKGELQKEADDLHVKAMESGKREDLVRWDEAEHKANNARNAFDRNVGRVAALYGYDAYKTGRGDTKELVVLNRGAVVVAREKLKP